MAHVLIIDEDQPIREALHQLVELDGHRAMMLPGPQDALAHLLQSLIPLVVLFDAGIPRIHDGRVTALAYADDERLRRHAYICMTTQRVGLHPDLLAALTFRAVPIIEKPFDTDALLLLIAQAAATLSSQP